jgi:hypothetical protein
VELEVVAVETQHGDYEQRRFGRANGMCLDLSTASSLIRGLQREQTPGSLWGDGGSQTRLATHTGPVRHLA